MKGNDTLYYLLSFRSSYQQDNSEGVVTEINLDTHKTRVLASGIMVYMGENASGSKPGVSTRLFENNAG